MKLNQRSTSASNIIIAFFVGATLAWLTASPCFAAQQAKVSVFLIPLDKDASTLVTQLSDTFQKVLAQNPNLIAKDWDTLLLEFAGEIPTESINKAIAKMQNGTVMLKDGQPAEAIPILQESIKDLEIVLPFTKKQYLAQAMMALAVAKAQTGATAQAQETFVQLLTWRPKIKYDTALWDPSFQNLFDKARQQMKARKRGSVEITTNPSGAKAFIDGQFVGTTPTVAYGLKVGQHYATFKMTGYSKSLLKFTVDPAMQQAYHVDLKQSEKFLLLQQSLNNAQKELGSKQATSSMVDLRTFLFIDQVILATITSSGQNKLDIKAHLYDLRSKQLLNTSSMQLDAADMWKLNSLAQMLYMNVRYDGSIEAPAEPPPPPVKKSKPFYAKWWFWTAVAAGATAVILPIVYWPESQTCAEGYRCVTVDN